MNHIFNKTFYTTVNKENIIKKIESELRKWNVDNLLINENRIDFNFTIWKFGSNIKNLNEISNGTFELFDVNKQIFVKYTGYYSITTEIILILFFLLLGILFFWFFFVVAIAISIQLVSRISNLINIQNEMIKRLSENGSESN